MLAPWAVLASGLPRGLAWPLALLACAAGLQRWWHERRRPPAQLVVPPGERLASFDGAVLLECEAHWRGVLLFVVMRHRDGRRERRVWWPDTLPSAARRELRLAVQARRASRPPLPVAP